jgi:hypothetical protein
MKCLFCKSCLRIRRVEHPQFSRNYYVCELCGRIYKNDPFKQVEVVDEEAEYARQYLKLTKIGDDEV